jgi:hypothetical protein
MLGNPGVAQQTRELLTPCLEPIDALIEKACPAVMIPTEKGLVTGYGLVCPIGYVLVLAVNPMNHVGLHLPVPDDDIEKPDEIRQEGPASFWAFVTKQINDVKEAKKEDRQQETEWLARALFMCFLRSPSFNAYERSGPAVR